MSSQAVFDAIAQTLADAHARFGATAFTDRRRLIGLLADHVPDARREIRAVGTAIDEGVPGALLASERHLIGMEMDRQAERLDATTGLRIDIARPVVRGFAYAIGLGPLPSIYVASAPAAPATPTPVTPPSVTDRPPQSPTAPVPPPPAASIPVATDDDEDVFVFAGRTIPKKQAYLGAGGLLLVLASLQLLGGGESKNATPAATPTPVTVDTTGRSLQRLDLGTPVAEQNYANESTDFGIASQNALENDVGSPTPLLVPGGRRITTAALQRMLATEPAAVVIDVLGNPHPRTVRGAIFLPGAGNGGSVGDADQPRMAAALAQLTDNRKLRPVVFLCQGASCWESYNAVLRASAAGYLNLYWYRGGIAAWEAAGLPLDGTPDPID